MIIPSIDIMGGKAVQLRQGKEKALERGDVPELAKEFSRYGEVALIDLDAAFGKGDNTRLIKRICREVPCRVGGGIRTREKADDFLAAGAKRIIIGTNVTPGFLKDLPKERVIVAIDTKDGSVTANGWTEDTGKTPEEVMKETESCCSEFLFTDIGREGMLQGCDMKKARALRALTKNRLTLAGGISDRGEIRELEDAGINAQLGMALYTGRLRLDDAFLAVLDFRKGDGLIPTVVQDEGGQVLMLGFSSEESLRKALTGGRGIYYSRSRKRLWTKGETSGNVQELLRARYDCDRDALLFTVRQQGAACHLGGYSCFGDRAFGLSELYGIIRARIENPKRGSYTSRVAADEKSIMAKIREEAGEVVGYRDRDNLVWEIADLTYFLLVLMAKNGIEPSEVRDELWKRRR